jgi:diketogulonate reductase-like aldo/keto reductase
MNAMKTETIHTVTLPKIGIGTGRLGGTMWANRWRDSHWLAAVRSALGAGYSHIDTAEMYALGYSEELIRRAIQETGTKREKIFLTSKVWPNHLSYTSVLRACENSLRRLGTDYLDLYLIHWPNPLIPLSETFRALNQLVRDGKIRHIGVSNFNLPRLKEAQALSATPLLANQVPYSLFTRTYVRNGVLEYCQKNDILFTAYSPVRFGFAGLPDALKKIANAHGASTHQIALAWLIAQPRVITIPMSFNPAHQKQNLQAAEIELTKAEIDQLNGIA